MTSNLRMPPAKTWLFGVISFLPPVLSWSKNILDVVLHHPVSLQVQGHLLLLKVGLEKPTGGSGQRNFSWTHKSILVSSGGLDPLKEAAEVESPRQLCRRAGELRPLRQPLP